MDWGSSYPRTSEPSPIRPAEYGTPAKYRCMPGDANRGRPHGSCAVTSFELFEHRARIGETILRRLRESTMDHAGEPLAGQGANQAPHIARRAHDVHRSGDARIRM